MAGERGGHSIEHTEAIEQAPQRSGIAFQAHRVLDTRSLAGEKKLPFPRLAQGATSGDSCAADLPQLCPTSPHIADTTITSASLAACLESVSPALKHSSSG
jgi:hypothetical protein